MSSSNGRAPMPQAEASATVDKRVWLATVVLLLSVYLEMINITIVNVATPSIQADLGSSNEALQWIVASYSLAFAVVLLTGGRLGDIVGRRRMFLTGFVGFILASLLCAVAPNTATLIGARTLMGAAAAVMLPQVLSSLNVWFPEEKRAAAFGMLGATFGLGGLTAPLIGGGLVSANVLDLGWRAIFVLNVVLGLIIFAAAVALVRESRSPRPLRLDTVGVLIGGVGVFLLVYPVIQGRALGWPGWIWLMLLAAVPVFAVFVVVERRKIRKDGSPVADLRLFRERAFAGGMLVALVFYTGVVSIAFVLMIFLQAGYDMTAMSAGLAIVPLALLMVVGSIVSAGLEPKLGRTILQIGAAFSALAMVWLALVVGDNAQSIGFWDMAGPLALAGLGMGLVMAPLIDLILAKIPAESAGSASGMLNTMIQIGAAVGVAVIGVVFFGFLGAKATDAAAGPAEDLRAAAVSAGLSADDADGARAAFTTCFRDRMNAHDPTAVPASCTGTPPAALEQPIAAAAEAAVRNNFAGAFQRALYWEAAVFGATVLLLFLIPGSKHRRREETVPTGGTAAAADRLVPTAVD